MHANQAVLAVIGRMHAFSATYLFEMFEGLMTETIKMILYVGWLLTFKLDMLDTCRACCRAWLNRSLVIGVPAGIGDTPEEGPYHRYIRFLN